MSKSLESVIYISIIILLLLIVWAFGMRLEEQKRTFQDVQEQIIEQKKEVLKIQKTLENDTAADALLRTLKNRGIDIKSLKE